MEQSLREQHRSDILAYILRNMYMIPQDEYRGEKMWELLKQMSDFVLKISDNSFDLSIDEAVSVITVEEIDGRMYLLHFSSLEIAL